MLIVPGRDFVKLNVNERLLLHSQHSTGYLFPISFQPPYTHNKKSLDKRIHALSSLYTQCLGIKKGP